MKRAFHYFMDNIVYHQYQVHVESICHFLIQDNIALTHVFVIFMPEVFFLKTPGFFFLAETISLKSYQEKVPRSFLIPGSSNRIHVTASGFYSIYGSMCFSGRGFREDSISLAVRLEQVRGGSKRTVIRRSATLHRHPSSFVNVHFMESVWLNKATDLFLFISHPNALYSFPECNILMLFKTK